MSKVVLASSSKQRRTLLSATGLNFEVSSPDIEEKAITGKTLSSRVKNIALAKATLVAGRYPGKIVIAADTCVSLNNQVFEKPVDKSEALEMIGVFSGNWVTAVTGVAIIDSDGKIDSFHVESKALFRKLATEEIQKYVSSNPVTTWAGGFSPAYPEGMAFISQIDGSLTGFTHGFPIELILPKIQKLLD